MSHLEPELAGSSQAPPLPAERAAHLPGADAFLTEGDLVLLCKPALSMAKGHFFPRVVTVKN